LEGRFGGIRTKPAKTRGGFLDITRFLKQKEERKKRDGWTSVGLRKEEREGGVWADCPAERR